MRGARSFPIQLRRANLIVCREVRQPIHSIHRNTLSCTALYQRMIHRQERGVPAKLAACTGELVSPLAIAEARIYATAAQSWEIRLSQSRIAVRDSKELRRDRRFLRC